MSLPILAFSLGVLCLQWQPALPESVHFHLLSGILLCLPRGLRPGYLSRGLLLCGCLVLGFAWAAWRAELRLSEELAIQWEGRDIELSGVVASLPQEFAGGSRFEFDVESVSTAGVRVPGHLMLSWYQGRREDELFDPQPVSPGQRWQFTVRLKRPHGNANPGAFDYEVWLLERNIRATGYIRPTGARRLSGQVWRPAYLVEELREAVRHTYQRLLPGDAYPLAGVLLALAIGDQRAVNGDLWSVFNRTGTTHLMAISGLHVTMVAALFGWLVSALWRRRPALCLRLPAQKAGLLAAVLGAFAYTLLAGFAVPAQRTLYMLMVAALVMFSNRLLAPGRTLLLALLMVLLLDPWAVLAAGFWLSFCAVGALLFVGSARTGYRPGWRAQIAGWGLAQWTATLASLPILLLVFQQFSLVSPLANALAIPVISFVVTPLALLGAVLPWWPILALAHQVMDWLMLFLEWCAQWPVWQAAAPPGWAIGAAGAGVLICLLPKGMPGRWLGMLLLVPVLFWRGAVPPEGEVWLDVLDVGQGLATVVRTRDHVLIYDPGPLYSAESDAGQRVVVPYLRWLGVERIDTLVVTHRDSDHSGGTTSVRAALPVGEILTSVPELGGRPCVDGESWQWNGVDFRMLHPLHSSSAVNGKANHDSCVLRVEAGGQSVLLTSDIEAPDEAALLQRHPSELAADVLLVPHHGSRTSSTEPFLAAVAARAAIIPVGYRNRYGHPKAEVLDRYRAQGIPVWRTDRDGAIRVALGGSASGPTISAWRDEHRRYWHGR